MKIAIFFLLGVIAGAYAMRAYDHRHHPVPPSEWAKQSGGNLSDNVAEKLRQWRLSPDDIRDDLDRTGQVVRAKASVAGDRIADARILTVIKAKYVLDRDLSARDIGVSVEDGHVTLTGTVTSADQIGRAIELALDTAGAQNVVSRLVVSPKI